MNHSALLLPCVEINLEAFFSGNARATMSSAKLINVPKGAEMHFCSDLTYHKSFTNVNYRCNTAGMLLDCSSRKCSHYKYVHLYIS